LIKVNSAAVAVPDDLELLVVFDEKAVDGDVAYDWSPVDLGLRRNGPFASRRVDDPDE
jgi:hypothetical protein